MGGGVFEDAVRIRGILRDYRHAARSVGGVNAAQLRVVAGAIDSGAYGKRGNDLTGVGIEYDKLFVGARGKKAAIGGVERQSRRPFAVTKLIALGDGLLLGID